MALSEGMTSRCRLMVTAANTGLIVAEMAIAVPGDGDAIPLPAWRVERRAMPFLSHGPLSRNHQGPRPGLPMTLTAAGSLVMDAGRSRRRVNAAADG